jgi:hypothetical protein
VLHNKKKTLIRLFVCLSFQPLTLPWPPYRPCFFLFHRFFRQNNQPVVFDQFYGFWRSDFWQSVFFTNSRSMITNRNKENLINFFIKKLNATKHPHDFFFRSEFFSDCLVDYFVNPFQMFFYFHLNAIICKRNAIF